MRHYYVITSGKAIHESMIGIEKGLVENCELFFPSYNIPFKFLSIIHKLVFSEKYGWLLAFLPHSLWKKYYVLEKIKLSTSEENVIIIAPGLKIDSEINMEYLSEYKKNNGVKLVLLLFDSIDYKAEGGWKHVTEVFDIFDLVMTFDKKDAIKYNLEYFLLPYDAKNDVGNENILSDLFFVGYAKGREKLIESIYDKCCSHKVRCDFNIVTHKGWIRILFRKYSAIYNYRRLDYLDTIRAVKKTGCILEVLCEGQNASSLRYYEAVVMNKKLLTNNEEVKKMPFYNPKYIKVFSDENDIDFNWINRKEKIHYGYDGRFSVVNLIKKIDCLLPTNLVDNE